MTTTGREAIERLKNKIAYLQVTKDHGEDIQIVLNALQTLQAACREKDAVLETCWAKFKVLHSCLLTEKEHEYLDKAGDLCKRALSNDKCILSRLEDIDQQLAIKNRALKVFAQGHSPEWWLSGEPEKIAIEALSHTAGEGFVAREEVREFLINVDSTCSLIFHRFKNGPLPNDVLQELENIYLKARSLYEPKH